MTTVVGLYDTINDAQNAVDQLVSAGFTRDNVSVVSNNARGEYRVNIGDDVDGAGAGATGGALVGGTIGVLAGLGALAIPGIGPVIAAGPLLAGLAGAGVGALTGGLLGALTDAGISESDAHYYAEGIRRGGTLVMANVEEARADYARDVLNQAGAINVEERATTWRSSGWDRFDPNGDVYSDDTMGESYRRPLP